MTIPRETPLAQLFNELESRQPFGDEEGKTRKDRTEVSNDLE